MTAANGRGGLSAESSDDVCSEDGAALVSGCVDVARAAGCPVDVVVAAGNTGGSSLVIDDSAAAANEDSRTRGRSSNPETSIAPTRPRARRRRASRVWSSGLAGGVGLATTLGSRTAAAVATG
jgi:hypothetical protein